MSQVRGERPEDADAVRELLDSSFGRKAEARLVERLHASGKAELALVAEDSGRMLGYLLFSPISIDGGTRPTAVYALAPLAVMPAFQRLGIGSALVSAGLQRLRESGKSRVLVLGDPKYYSRFGFVPAARYNVRCPFPAPEEAFMAIELLPGAFAGCGGVARYGPEFADLE